MPDDIMSEEQDRLFQKVGRPEDRPRRTRTTVRVILVNEADQTLLFEDSDPGLPEFRWWVVPGGGMDPGESEQQTAIREVQEETGLQLRLEDLLGPVARRHVVHGYSDQVIEQDETFFVSRVSRFEVDVAGHTEEEKLTLQQSRWWDRKALVETGEWIWPARLLELWDLADTPEKWSVDLGDEEESTWSDVAHATRPESSRPGSSSTESSSTGSSSTESSSTESSSRGSSSTGSSTAGR